MNDAVREEAVEVYSRDDYKSWSAPGMRYVSVVGSDNGKQTVQNRYLTMTVFETYSILKKENPGMKLA
jgi:hypothetical protein